MKNIFPSQLFEESKKVKFIIFELANDESASYKIKCNPGLTEKEIYNQINASMYDGGSIGFAALSFIKDPITSKYTSYLGGGLEDNCEIYSFNISKAGFIEKVIINEYSYKTSEIKIFEGTFGDFGKRVKQKTTEKIEGKVIQFTYKERNLSPRTFTVKALSVYTEYPNSWGDRYIYGLNLELETKQEMQFFFSRIVGEITIVN